MKKKILSLALAVCTGMALFLSGCGGETEKRAARSTCCPTLITKTGSTSPRPRPCTTTCLRSWKPLSAKS